MKSGVNPKYIYSDLSHEIIGSAYEVQNHAGLGRPEKTYQRLMAVELRNRGIKFNSQVKVDIIYKGIKAATRYLDFVIYGKDGEVVVELKVGSHISKGDYEQTYEYLLSSGIKLGLIILFSNNGVTAKRVVNINNPISVNQ
ncbi:MAG: GxxExxY protein [Patescibacteria group bacterium]